MSVLDLSKLSPDQLAAIYAVVPSPDVANEVKARVAFLDFDEAMDEVAVIRARLDAFKLGRVTDVAKHILTEIGVDNLLNRLLATAHVKQMVVATPTLEQIKVKAAPAPKPRVPASPSVKEPVVG